jgi:Immunity protein 35
VISEQEAREIAEDYVRREIEPRIRVELALSELSEYSTCWVAVYNTRRFLETGSNRDALAGNGPLIINRRTGVLREGRSALPVEEQLDAD